MTLNETINILKSINRLKELETVFKGWKRNYIDLHTNIKFSMFNGLFCSIDKGYRRKAIDLAYLDENFEHYLDMTDVRYPEVTTLKRLIKEYNKLVATLGNIDCDYILSESIKFVNKIIKE